MNSAYPPHSNMQGNAVPAPSPVARSGEPIDDRRALFFVVFLAAVLGVWARFSATGKLGLTQDEMEAIASIQNSGSIGAQASAAVRATIEAGVLPGYAVVAGVWASLVGETVPVLRLFSVVLGLVTVLGAAASARILTNSKIVGWCVLLIAIVSPYFIRYSVRAGPEALALAMIAASSWALLKSLIEPRTRYWVCYVLTVAVGILSHPIFVPIVFGHILFALLQLAAKRLSARAAMWVVGTVIGALSIATPWRSAFFAALTPESIKAPLTEAVPSSVELLLGNIGLIIIANPLVLSMFVAIASLIALGGLIAKVPPSPRNFIVCVGIVPMLVIVGIDHLWATKLISVPFNIAPLAIVVLSGCGAWIAKGLISSGVVRIVTVVLLLGLVFAGFVASAV